MYAHAYSPIIEQFSELFTMVDTFELDTARFYRLQLYSGLLIFIEVFERSLGSVLHLMDVSQVQKLCLCLCHLCTLPPGLQSGIARDEFRDIWELLVSALFSEKSRKRSAQFCAIFTRN